MNAIWLAASYLFDRVRCRARAARDGNPESGALSLEWIVIAVAVAAAAAGVAAAIGVAISSETSRLP